MVTALLHGGPRDGETLEQLPWARLEIAMPRWEGDPLEDTGEDLYRLRPPWRGQELAHYDYVEAA